jgi:hypothetical protein
MPGRKLARESAYSGFVQHSYHVAALINASDGAWQALAG